MIIYGFCLTLLQPIHGSGQTLFSGDKKHIGPDGQSRHYRILLYGRRR